MKLRTFGTLAAVSMLVGVTGCSSTAPGQPVTVVRTYHGTAVGQVSRASSDARPTVYWIAGRRDVVLTAYGSSSCPPVPESLEVASPTRVDLQLKDYGGACTADLGATTSEFELPADVSRHRTVRVTLHASGMTATTLRLRPNPAVASDRG